MQTPTKKKLILLVEHDEKVRSYFESQIIELGYDVISIKVCKQFDKLKDSDSISLIMIDNDILSDNHNFNKCSALIINRRIPHIIILGKNETNLKKDLVYIDKYSLFCAENASTFWIEKNIDWAYLIYESRSKLIDAQNQLKGLINTIPDLVWVKDVDGVYQYCNHQIELLLGSEASDIIGKTDYDFFDKELADFFREKDKIAIEKGRPSINEDEITYASDGHKDFVETIKTPMCDQNGNAYAVLGISRSISERRLIQDKLIKEKEYSEEVINSLPDIYYQISKNLQLVKWNKKFELISGYSSKELANIKADILFDEKDKIKTQASISKAFTEGFVEVSASLISKDGKKIPYYLTATKKEFDGEEFILGMGIDISALKKTEIELQQSLKRENQLADIFRNSPLAIAFGDSEGGIQILNEAFVQLTGYSREELKDLELVKSLTPKKWIDFETEKLKELTLSNPVIKFQKEYITKQGKVVPIELVIKAHFEKDKNIEKYVAFISDITERKNSEEEVKKFRTISDNAVHGNAIIDINGNFIYFNDYFAKIYGYKRDELEKENMKALLSKKQIEKGEKLKNNLLENGYYHPDDTMHTKKDGTEFPVLASSIVINDDNGHPKYIATTVFDLTELSRLKQENIMMEQHLRNQQKLESIGTLASGVAHEINNPINGIMNYAQLISDINSSDNDSAKYANEIITETKRISAIVKDLLQFSRQEGQSFSYAKVTDIIGSAMSLIKTIIKLDQIELVLDIENNLPKIKCLSQQIQQVIMNLLTNARFALNEKYEGYNENKKIEIKANKFSLRKEPWIRITVKDYGNGIPESIRGNIFDPFFTTKSRSYGTGLGLSISYGIVQAHYGKLDFDTKVGAYTKFILELPVNHNWPVDTKEY